MFSPFRHADMPYRLLLAGREYGNRENRVADGRQNLVLVEGLEPPPLKGLAPEASAAAITPCQLLNQMARADGIEPPSAALEAAAQPIYHALTVGQNPTSQLPLAFSVVTLVYVLGAQRRFIFSTPTFHGCRVAYEIINIL